MINKTLTNILMVMTGLFLLIIFGIFDEKKLNKLAEVCPINLVQNVDMHNDTRFLKQMGYSPKVYFFGIGNDRQEVIC